MKTTIRLITLCLTAVFVYSGAFAGVNIASDMYFNTTMEYQVSNAVYPGGLNSWVARNSYLYVGLYPQISEKTIKGDARLFVSSSNGISIYYGGAKATGWTENKMFTATAFAFTPAFALSDPMKTGMRYSSDVYTSPTAFMTRFTDPENYAIYPVTINTNWMNGYNYEMGGNNSVGLYTKLDFIEDVLNLEDYFSWNVNNFYSMGLQLKVEPLDVIGTTSKDEDAILTLSGGITLEMLKYNSPQTFKTYNAFYFFDLLKMLPQQSSLYEDSYLAYGGYLNAGVMGLANIFGQVKLNNTKGLTTKPDAPNSLDGMDIFAGVYSTAIEGSLFELDLGMVNQTTNTNFGRPASRNDLMVEAKAYADYDIDEDYGLSLALLADVAYVMYNNSINLMNRFENLVLPANYTNASGLNARFSVRFDFLGMFSFREIGRYAMLNFSSPDTYALSQLESRSYLDVDLSDFVEGLSLTGGVTFTSYALTPSASGVTLQGTASYILPYGEVKYSFGKDNGSFVRLTYGLGENQSVIANAYGLGVDNYRKMNTSFAMTPDTSLLYNTVDNYLSSNPAFNLEAGLKL